MKIISLASGSKGNAIYLETNHSKILFDAGISLTKMKQRLLNHNLQFTSLDAIFISHEHTDHTKFILPILERTNAKLFINQLSFEKLNKNDIKNLADYHICFVDKEKKYFVNTDVIVVPIELSHDSVNIFGFLIKAEEENIGIVTDTGFIPDKYLPLLQKMHIVFLESNHDVDMLLTSSRPWLLKQRILSTHGHLSNDECANILPKIIGSNTKCIILSHLSEECNTPTLAYQTAFQILKDTHIKLLVASEEQEIDVLEEIAA